LNQKIFSKDEEKNNLIEQIGNQYLQVQKDHEIEIQLLKDQVQHVLKNTASISSDVHKQNADVLSSLNMQKQQQKRNSDDDNDVNNNQNQNYNNTNNNNSKRQRQNSQRRQLPSKQNKDNEVKPKKMMKMKEDTDDDEYHDSSDDGELVF